MIAKANCTRPHRIVNLAPEQTPSTPLLTIADRVATILLRRPKEHNRLDPDDLPILIDQLDEVEADPTAEVLLFRGSGSRTFSSGYTVEAILSRLEERTFEKFLNRLENLARPSIVVIQGGVYGGATDLALCCDLRIGVHSSRMFMPAARFGLHYYADGLRRYVSRLGPTAARKLLLTGCTIEAREMLRIGFLTDVVAPDELEATVSRYVQQLLACDGGAIAAMKRSLNQLGEVDPAVLGAIEERFLGSLRPEALHQRLATATGNSRR